MKNRTIAIALSFAASAAMLSGLACGSDPDGSGGQGASNQGGGPSGGGGSGGDGAALPTICEPDMTEPCYDGDEGTEGVGLCVAGEQTCSDDGTAWGTCIDQVIPDVEQCNALGDEDCDGIACSETSWSAGFVGGHIEVRDSAVDAAGNSYLVATVSSDGAIAIGADSLNHTGTSAAMVVIKVDPEGSPLWFTTTGNASATNRPRIAVDPTGGVVAGAEVLNGSTVSLGIANGGSQTGPVNGEKDIFLVKLDDAGQHVWSTYLGARATSLPPTIDPVGNKELTDIAVDPSGNVYAVGFGQGHWGGTCIPNCPNSFDQDAAFVRKLDNSGAVQWSRTLDGPGSQLGMTATATADAVFVGGSFDGELDFNGQTVLPVVPLVTPFRAGFLGRLSAAGDTVWVQAYEAQVHNILADGSRLLVAGLYRDGQSFGLPPSDGVPPIEWDAYVAELDLDGNPAWATAHPQGVFSGNIDVAAGPDGEVVIAGPYEDTFTVVGTTLEALSITQAFVIAHDPMGTALWARGFANPEGVDQKGLTVGADGHVLVSGNYDGPVDMGNQVLPHSGITNVYLAKLQP
jgi:hypothetical protein